MIANSRQTGIVILLLAGMFFSSTLGPANAPSNVSASVAQFPIGSGSWNPKVPCSSPWIVRVTDITDNMTGSSSLSSSIFNPGITSPVGTAKRWLTPGNTPSGWTSPGPPCMITNSHGTVAMFVEIDGVKRTSLVDEDCTGTYDAVNGGGSNGGSYCDSTFNFYDPAVVPNYSTSCTSTSDPTCYGRIHSEIDHDWKAAKYCGVSTTCDNSALSSQTTTSSMIDFQGFIYWDPGNLNQGWHSFSGWEIHPLTGWRLSGGGIHTTSTAVSCNPPTLVVGVDTKCTANVTDTSGTPTAPAGTVSFSVTGVTGSFSSLSCALTSGSCSVSFTPSSPGSATVTAVYSGDSSHSGSSGKANVTVNKRTTGTSINCSPNPVGISQSTTCTATVTDSSPGTSSTPTGTVAFTSTGAGSFIGSPCNLATGQAGAASCSVTYSPSGNAPRTDTITAVYSPSASDSVHNGSQGTFPLGVGSFAVDPTSTNVSCSPSTVVIDQTTACTATVTDTATTNATPPTGTVTFTPGGSCTLSNPSGTSAGCSVNIAPSSAGNLSVSASYAGDATHGTSSGSTSVTVNKRATSTSIHCNPTQVDSNGSTNCTATVTDTDAGTIHTPTGTVSFTTNSTGTFTPSGSCALGTTATAGVANCSINYAPGSTGHHVITATYTGDSGHAASIGTVTLTVAPQPPPPSQTYGLVVSHEGKVFRYQNGAFTLIGQPVTTPLRQVAWRPDGSYALIMGDSGVLLRYDGSQLTTIPTGITANLYALAWKPDGSYALISGSGGPLFKYDGVLTRLANPFTTSIRSISWNPSGTQALLVGASGSMLLYQSSNGQISQISSGTTAYLYASAWNPNGLYALAAGENGIILRYDGTSVTALSTVGLYDSTAVIHAVSWNPSGTTALLVGDVGVVLTYDGSQLARVQSPANSNLYAISWLGSTAYIAGGSGPSLTYTGGVLSTLVNNTGTSLRGWAWKPS